MFGCSDLAQNLPDGVDHGFEPLYVRRNYLSAAAAS